MKGTSKIRTFNQFVNENMNDRKVDLFEHPELIPHNIEILLDEYFDKKESGEEGVDYDDTADLLKEIENWDIPLTLI